MKQIVELLKKNCTIDNMEILKIIFTYYISCIIVKNYNDPLGNKEAILEWC